MEIDTTLYNHIRNTSESDYQNYITEKGAIDTPREWEPILKKVFRKLIQASLQPSFQPTYSIVNQSSLNAMAFPGGQFVFHKGLFQSLDERIKSKENPQTSKEWALYRENYLAPVIAHELSHYYNDHSFKAFKNIFDAERTGKRNLEMLRFDQEIELEADLGGLILLQKSGYNPEYFVKVLQIMNDNYQESKKNGKKINPYFQTHPSPNARLAKVSSNQKEFFLLMASLERAYADIQMGQNLEHARTILERALSEYPGSKDLLKADAVALHKIWLETVPLAEQKLKSILELPSFRDAMVASIDKKKAVTKKIPGDPRKFRKAVNAYKKIELMSDFWLVSNFATLLAYSDDSKDEQNALELGKLAFDMQKNIQTINNLGVVFFLCGKKEEAKQIFSTMAMFLHKDWRLTHAKKGSQHGNKLAQEWKKAMDAEKKDIQNLNEDQSAIIINLLLVQTNSPKELILNFYDEYDTDNVWANYIENVSGVNIPKLKIEKNALHLEKIKPEMNLKDLMEKWSKPSAPASLENGKEAWYYYDKGTKISLHNGRISEIYVFGEESPSLSNGIQVGTTKEKVDKVMGKPKKGGSHFIYKKNGNLVVFYDEGVVERFYLLKE